MLGQNQPAGGRADDKQRRLDTAAALLSCKDYANAYLLLEPLERELSVPVLFNLALCCYFMKKFVRAASLLERAWTEAGKRGGLQKAVCRQPDSLDKQVVLQGTEHRSYMPEKMPELLVFEARERIARLMIDAYSYIGNIEKVKSYTNMLSEKNYAHVLEAAERAENGGL